MQFVYDKKAGAPILTIEGENYKYLFRVRRTPINAIIDFRNLQDENIYRYKVVHIDKKSATLELILSEEKSIVPKKEFILGWCIIDPKNIEKALPSLNEIGVGKLVFIKCAYSQANFKIKKERILKILINSNQQCGRSNLMEVSFSNSLYSFLQEYPNSFLLHFTSNLISQKKEKIASLVIGCEGGFSKDELKLFKQEQMVGFDSSLILKSETAAIAAASKILL